MASDFRTRYERLEEIGCGAFSSVYRVLDRRKNVFYAGKRSKLTPEYGISGDQLRDYAFSSYLGGRHGILPVNGTTDLIFGDKYVWLILPLQTTRLRLYVESIFEKGMRWTVETIRRYFFQLLQTLDYVHCNGVVHCDIKSDNILYNESSDCLYLIDFGQAQRFTDPAGVLIKQEIVTLFYRAPELILGTQMYTPAQDIWSLATVFLEMLVGKPIFYNGGLEASTLKLIYKLIGTPTEETWPGVTQLRYWHSHQIRSTYLTTRDENLRAMVAESCSTWSENDLDMLTDLLVAMFTPNPSQRPSARTLLNHPFFTAVTALSCPPADVVSAGKQERCVVAAVASSLAERLFVYTCALQLDVSLYFRALKILSDYASQKEECGAVQALAALWLASKLEHNTDTIEVGSLTYVQSDIRSSELLAATQTVLKTVPVEALLAPIVSDFVVGESTRDYLLRYLLSVLLCYGSETLSLRPITPRETVELSQQIADRILCERDPCHVTVDSLEYILQSLVLQSRESPITSYYTEERQQKVALLFRPIFVIDSAVMS